MDQYAGETLFLNRGHHGCWVVCILNLKLWSIPFLPVNQKANPWNFASETLKKLHLPDPPEAKWLIRSAWLVAVRHVAGSAAHEAHWPNPVSPRVPHIHTWALSPFGVMFAASASSSPFSEMFYLKHYIVAKGTLGYLVEGIHFILGFIISTFCSFEFVAPSALEPSLALSPAVLFWGSIWPLNVFSPPFSSCFLFCTLDPLGNWHSPLFKN